VSLAPTAESAAPETPESPAPKARLTSLFSNFELIIVVLLGLVSVATAYASFQAALYDSQMAGAYAKGQSATASAESLYLEANQQYIQDVQVWSRLTELSIDMDNADPSIAQSASDKFDTLYFQSVGETLDAAITWSSEQNTADSATYSGPFDSEDYMVAMFTPYLDATAEAEAMIAEGDVFNTHSDRLTLNTVMMALSLFLLGIAAVVRGARSQVVLTAVATVIFAISLVLTATVPFVSI
jgi:hypothetical protein